MPRYLMELVGTFFLVLIIGLSVAGADRMAPVGIGLGLTALVYMGGPVSGAHYNPAVTFGLWLRGACKTGDVLPYVAAQIIGGTLGAVVSVYLCTSVLHVQPGEGVSLARAGVAELAFTCLLMLVIFHVAVAPKVQGNSYYGLAIGVTVLSAAYAVGSISGASLNPAVTLGAWLGALLLGSAAAPESVVPLIYVGAELVGAGVAVLLFHLQLPREKPEA